MPWAVGICTHCGTITAFRTTTPTARALIRTRTFYCPACGLFKLTQIKLAESTQLERVYSEMRLQNIIGSHAWLDRKRGQDDGNFTKEIVEESPEFDEG
jgi:hypothetical protein